MKIPRSKRARRVGVELQKIIADEIRRRVEPRLEDVVISVPEVRVSDDLEHARIYVSIFGDEGREEAQRELKKALPRMRKAAADALHIRKIPELRFFWDDTMERADRIEQLLNKLHNSSSPPKEDEGGAS